MEELEKKIRQARNKIIAIRLISLIIGAIFMILVYKFLGFERTVLIYLFAIFVDRPQARE